MHTTSIDQANPEPIARRPLSGPATDFLRVAIIIAGFIGLGLVLGHFTDDRSPTHAAQIEDWHGNVSSSRR